MRLLLTISLLFITILSQAAQLFYYSPSDGKGGLRFAVKEKSGNWNEIGDGFNFLSSDFGSWGSGKKMYNPLLVKDGEDWKIVFSVTPQASVYGVAVTSDFIHWKPQEYIRPADLAADLKTQLASGETKVQIGEQTLYGRFINVDENIINELLNYVSEKKKRAALYSERSEDDAARFKNLKPLKGSLKISSDNKEISPVLLGVFFEDINYAADGGLYAELIQNRDFEYKEGETRDKKWGPDYAWEVKGKNLNFSIKDENPLSQNNPHYAQLVSTGQKDLSEPYVGLYNNGFDGISLKKGEPYKFNIHARSNEEMPLKVSLVDDKGKEISSTKISVIPSSEWNKYEAILNPDADYQGASLRIMPENSGVIDIDMVSLFPVNTFKGRENGLRADLAQTIADMKPQFVRFPGGCVAHGNGIDNIYDWKGSIGPLEDRKPLFNLWGYHQTRGLGYHEYFQFCEDIGALPVPVLAAGVPCQNSSVPSKYTVDDLTLYGQQQGIPMDSIDSYIQDVLDLIEYATGDSSSEWGAKRAAAGHPEPFDLKYIGIGNEDMITEVFKERFKVIKDAVKKAYPEIIVIGTTGPFYEGSDYEEGWNFARQENVDMVDEHYYVEPGWLIYNQNFYDDYDRNGPKVYLGEWAAHLPDRSSTIETALAEALYVTSLERNGDVVLMSSYAPLLAKKNHTQWRPDLIYFDNDNVYPTTDYQSLKLAGNNAGNLYHYNSLNLDNDQQNVTARIGASVVKDTETGKMIVKLVNMLPVSCDLDIDISEICPQLPSEGKKGNVTVMSGNPADTHTSLADTEITIDSQVFPVNMPPYSFTVINF